MCQRVTYIRVVYRTCVFLRFARDGRLEISENKLRSLFHLLNSARTLSRPNAQSDEIIVNPPLLLPTPRSERKFPLRQESDRVILIPRLILLPANTLLLRVIELQSRAQRAQKTEN